MKLTSAKLTSALILAAIGCFTLSSSLACDLAKKRGTKPSATQSLDEPLFPQTQQSQHMMQQHTGAMVQQRRATIMKNMQHRRGRTIAQWEN